MSSLDLIRSLRRALAALRDADTPLAVSSIAHALAAELEAQRDMGSGVSLDELGTDDMNAEVSFTEMAVVA